MELLGIFYVGSVIVFGVAFAIFLGVASENFERQRAHQIAEQERETVEALAAAASGNTRNAA